MDAAPTRSPSSRETCGNRTVDAIVLPDARPEAPALLTSLSKVFGDPAHIEGVYVWDVREVRHGAG